MARILITGGTGVLARQLTPRLSTQGHTVRILSRGPRRSGFAAEVEWAQASLESGHELAAAMDKVDAVIHAASSPVRAHKIEVQGTESLMAACAKAVIDYLLYISIVGVEHFPKLAYYQAKLGAEQIIKSGPVP